MKKFKIAEFISTFFYVGREARFCPGTIGSIATLPLWFMIIFFITKFQLNFVVSAFIVTFIIGIAGLWSTKIYIEETKKNDPKEVVIDEVVGQLLSFIFSFIFVFFFAKDIDKVMIFSAIHTHILQIFLFITPIALFRLFDIKKPLLIGWIDKNVNNAYGIMLDDVVAGVCAGILNSILIYLLVVIL